MKLSALLLLAFLFLTACPGRGAEPLTAGDVLRRAEDRFRSLHDYECLADAETRLGRKSDSGIYRVWFKKPHQLRVRVVKGRHKASEVAMDAGGSVRGHEGGLLKPIVIKLKATDKRLCNLRGVPVTELDWGSFYTKCRERTARAGARTTLIPGADEAPHEVVVTYPHEGKAMREVYRIDPKLWVMVEGSVYEDEVRVDLIRFREIRLDPGLEDRWFKL